MLPGMKISPMFVIWQSEKPQIVTDHSASGLNDSIFREDAKVQYNDMQDFRQYLHECCHNNTGKHLILFKDDVASAFLNLPAHPIWQLMQTVIVDTKLHIVCCLVFGNHASPQIWCIISGLLCWIALPVLHIPDLYVYMDDYFGWDFKVNMVFYHGQLHL
jgi:hypothetical protein